MTSFNDKLIELVQRDNRYAYEAYEFVFQALHYSQEMLGKLPPENAPRGEAVEAGHHVTGQQLLEGIRALALREFGYLARTVLHMWGIDNTVDFGQIVFNLIDAELMSKTENDNLEDFRDVYDLDEALVASFRIELDEAH